MKHTSMPQQPDHFVLLQQKLEISRAYATWPLCRVFNDQCPSIRWPIISVTYKLKFQKGVDGRTRDVLEQCMTTCRKAARTQANRRSSARIGASAKEIRGYLTTHFLQRVYNAVPPLYLNEMANDFSNKKVEVPKRSWWSNPRCVGTMYDNLRKGNRI